ncbi:MAG: hypothetical protein HY534_06925 [Chloroflexi bacterium]|nr:hypothetical protein [Chloroflexota bacterium]
MGGTIGQFDRHQSHLRQKPRNARASQHLQFDGLGEAGKIEELGTVLDIRFPAGLTTN